MSQLLILLTGAGVWAAAYVVGIRYLGLDRSFRHGIVRTLETTGLAVVFFFVDVLIIGTVLTSIRAFGIFVALSIAGDPVIVALAAAQGLVFQFWRYSGGTGRDR